MTAQAVGHEGQALPSPQEAVQFIGMRLTPSYWAARVVTAQIMHAEELHAQGKETYLEKMVQPTATPGEDGRTQLELTATGRRRLAGAYAIGGALMGLRIWSGFDASAHITPSIPKAPHGSAGNYDVVMMGGGKGATVRVPEGFDLKADPGMGDPVPTPKSTTGTTPPPQSQSGYSEKTSPSAPKVAEAPDYTKSGYGDKSPDVAPESKVEAADPELKKKQTQQPGELHIQHSLEELYADTKENKKHKGKAWFMSLTKWGEKDRGVKDHGTPWDVAKDDLTNRLGVKITDKKHAALIDRYADWMRGQRNLSEADAQDLPIGYKVPLASDETVQQWLDEVNEKKLSSKTQASVVASIAELTTKEQQKVLDADKAMHIARFVPGFELPADATHPAIHELADAITELQQTPSQANLQRADDLLHVLRVVPGYEVPSDGLHPAVHELAARAAAQDKAVLAWLDSFDKDAVAKDKNSTVKEALTAAAEAKPTKNEVKHAEQVIEWANDKNLAKDKATVELLPDRGTKGPGNPYEVTEARMEALHPGLNPAANPNSPLSQEAYDQMIWELDKKSVAANGVTMDQTYRLPVGYEWKTASNTAYHEAYEEALRAQKQQDKLVLDGLQKEVDNIFAADALTWERGHDLATEVREYAGGLKMELTEKQADALAEHVQSYAKEHNVNIFAEGPAIIEGSKYQLSPAIMHEVQKWYEENVKELIGD